MKQAPGKLTATLVRLGADVTAVEPDPQMLAELRRAMPAVRWCRVARKSCRCPTPAWTPCCASQSMHWFDLNRHCAQDGPGC